MLKIKVITLILALTVSTGCNSNIFDPLSGDGRAIPIISTAESLTEEGDAHFANGNLEAAKKSYEAALKKDDKYQGAIIGLVAVKLQVVVKEEFPGKETFTAAAIPLVYDPLTSLAGSSSTTTDQTNSSNLNTPSLSFGNIQNSPDVAIIRSKTRLFSVVDEGFNKLIAIPKSNTSLIVSITALLAYDLIYRLSIVLEDVESLETLAAQLEIQSGGGTQFDSGANEIFNASIPVDDPVQIISSLDSWKNTYQKLYYVYYFFKNDFTAIESQLIPLDNMLTAYTGKVTGSNNKIIRDIVPQIQSIQVQIKSITDQFDQAGQITAQFENQVVPKIRDLENQLSNLSSVIKNQINIANFDISLCGLTLLDSTSGTNLTGEINKTQLDSDSIEYLSLPILSDDPDEPCSGNNPRFSSPLP